MEIQIFESAQFGQVRTMTGENGEQCCTTKVTGKGQRYFVEGFLLGKF